MRPINEVQIRPITTPMELQEWDQFVTRSSVGHMQQCRWWADPLKEIGVVTHILGCWKGETLLGGALFRSVPVPILGMTITECLSGPIFCEWQSDWADLFVRRLRELAKDVNSVTVSIQGCRSKDVHQDLVRAFDRQELKVSLTRGVLEAVLLLEERAMEDLWDNFRTLTKRSVKKGLAGPIRVERLTIPRDLIRAYESWMATARRQKFSRIRAWPAIEPVLRHSVDSGAGQVLATFLDDRLLASVFVTHIGESSSYVYGGYMDGAESYRPTHVLQYVAIQEAIERGMTTYTFGELNEEPSWTGVDQFKLGFGASPQRNLDTITWERRPVCHRLIEWIRGMGVGKTLENLLMRQRGAYARP